MVHCALGEAGSIDAPEKRANSLPRHVRLRGPERFVARIILPRQVVQTRAAWWRCGVGGRTPSRHT